MVKRYLFALLFSASASAETLDTVVVHAEADHDLPPPRVGDVVLDEHTGNHRRIEREQLLRPGGSLGDILALETGVQHSQAGAEGSYSAITLRGASAAQTPVYLDGLRLNSAAQAVVDLADLEVLQLESVDIYQGRAPMQLGGGIGGALALNSPRGRGESTRVRAQLGSFGSGALQAGHSRGGERWQVHAIVSHRRADNDFTLLNDNGTEFNPNDDRRERRHNAGFQRDTLLTKLSLFPRENAQYDLSVQHSAKDLGVPEWRNLADNQASLETRNTLVQLNQRLSEVRGTDWNTRLGVHSHRRREAYDDRLSQVGVGAQHTRSRSDTAGLSAYAERVGASGTLALQAQLREEKMRNDDWIDVASASARRDERELGAHYAWFSENEQWLLSAGARWLGLDDKYRGLYRDGRDRRSGDHSSLSLGAQYDPSPRWRWQFNLGELHREPSFHELFGDRGLHVGNDELEAESGVNADLSGRWRHANGELTLTAFLSDRDNLIATVFSAQGIGHSENVGGARVQGLEFSAVQDLGPSWVLHLTLTAQDAENRSRIAAFRGKQLPGQAQLQGALRLGHTREHSHWWLEARAQDGKYYDTANLLPAEDHLVLDAGVSFERQAWSFSINLNNLSDDQIEDFNGFARPGRSAHLSASYRF